MKDKCMQPRYNAPMHYDLVLRHSGGFGVVILLALLTPLSLRAQEQTYRGVADYVPMAASEIVLHGQLVRFFDGAYTLSSTPYDDHLVGVVSRSPSLALSAVGKVGAVPLVTTGTTPVMIKGALSVGDFVTSSNTPGVGQRAEQPGYIIGRALASFEPASPNATGLVLTTVGVQFMWPPGTGVPLGAVLANPREAVGKLPPSLRYLAALVTVLLALMAGYLIYSRTSASTVAALGRNPLAKNTIIVLAGFQTLATLALVAVGLVLGYFILIL